MRGTDLYYKLLATYLKFECNWVLSCFIHTHTLRRAAEKASRLFQEQLGLHANWKLRGGELGFQTLVGVLFLNLGCMRESLREL